jgi:UPF0755 protein
LSQFGPGPGDDPGEPLLDHGDADDRYQDESYAEEPPDEPRPEPSRRGRGCLPVLIVLAVLVGGGWFGGRWAFDEISTRLAPAPDYAGPGNGSVLYQVQSGASSTQIGRELKAADVVKSVDAFSKAARENDRSRNIQVGYYQLKKKMKASQALEVLVDPGNLLQSLVVVPEGARVDQIVKAIVDKTDITRKAVTAALANPRAIGLPAEARGNPEGYLFPATYTVPPKQTALGLIKQMVAKTVEVEQSLDMATKAREVNLNPEQVLTVASILEYEANRSEDYPKVARVLYNRLNQGMRLSGPAPRPTTPTGTPACLPDPSAHPARRPSRPRCRPRRVTGCSSSPTTRRRRPASPLPSPSTTSGWTSSRSTAEPTRSAERCAVPFSAHPSLTPCPRPCTGRPTSTWASTGPMTHCWSTPPAWRSSSTGWAGSGVGSR